VALQDETVNLPGEKESRGEKALIKGFGSRHRLVPFLRADSRC